MTGAQHVQMSNYMTIVLIICLFLIKPYSLYYILRWTFAIILVTQFSNLYPDSDIRILKDQFSGLKIGLNAFKLEVIFLIAQYLLVPNLYRDLRIGFIFSRLVLLTSITNQLLKYLKIYNYSGLSHRHSFLHRPLLVNGLIFLFLAYQFNFNPSDGCANLIKQVASSPSGPLIICFIVGIWAHYMVDFFGFMTTLDYAFNVPYVLTSPIYTVLVVLVYYWAII